MRQKILKRAHIDTEYKHLFDYPLTLAVAAMGYGKTTSARAYLNNSASRYIWLTVDSDESSPQFIWDSLASQLSKTNPEIGGQLRTFGFPVDAPQRDKVLRIIEDLTYMSDSVLVIDDYHNAHSQELDRLIERLVRANIKGFHILILSRTMPEINVDELLLKRYCHLIKSSLFEVMLPEIQAFFKLYGHDIPETTARRVYEISEGWVSAVYLIMQDYAETGKILAGQSMERLIETAVMKRYNPKEVRFLKFLCILDSFTSQQVAYMTRNRDAERILRKISCENSFIRYDKQEDVYRIHKLFNGYLQKLVETDPPEVGVKELYRRSGEWYIQNGETLAGLKHLNHAKQYDLILEEFEKSASITRIMDASPKYVLNVFEQIPQEVKLRHPIGHLAYIGFYVTNVDRNEGHRLLSELERYYNQGDSGLSSDMLRRIHGEIELIYAYISFNDAPLMRERFIRAYSLLGGHSHIANESKIITFGSPHSLYLYYRESGNLRNTTECVQDMFRYYTELAKGCGRGFHDLLEAEYCLETGELEKAELHARKAAHKARSFQQISVLISSVFTIARIFAARGQFDKALTAMSELRPEVEAASGPILISAFDVAFGYIGGIAACEDHFSQWLGEGDLEQSEILYQGMGFHYIAYGKQLLLKEDFIGLELLCEQMQQVFAPFHNMLGYLHASILSAGARYHLYGIDSAVESLLTALEMGRADGIVLPFAEYGAYILEPLKEVQKRIGEDDYLNRLVNNTNCYADNRKAFHAQTTELPSLTKREKEILAHVADGKSNREIACALFVAEVTVRKNITSIYRKLNVTGRAAAIRKALEQKIFLVN